MHPEKYWLVRNAPIKKSSESSVRKRKRASPRNNMSTCTIYVMDNTLDTKTGKLRCHVNHTGLTHLPVPPTAKKPICTCHWWAGDRDTLKVAGQIILC
eukprot:scaffold42240_cov60-Attheya_sp.AAC.4